MSLGTSVICTLLFLNTTILFMGLFEHLFVFSPVKVIFSLGLGDYE